MKRTDGTDHDLKDTVSAAIDRLPNVNSAHIGVSVTHGLVTLSGEVDSDPERYLAKEAALQVHGVLAVAEEITVRPAVADDRIIAQRARAARERVPPPGRVM